MNAGPSEITRYLTRLSITKYLLIFPQIVTKNIKNNAIYLAMERMKNCIKKKKKTVMLECNPGIQHSISAY